jgi:hypothetical protein
VKAAEVVVPLQVNEASKDKKQKIKAVVEKAKEIVPER